MGRKHNSSFGKYKYWKTNEITFNSGGSVSPELYGKTHGSIQHDILVSFKPVLYHYLNKIPFRFKAKSSLRKFRRFVNMCHNSLVASPILCRFYRSVLLSLNPLVFVYLIFLFTISIAFLLLYNPNFNFNLFTASFPNITHNTKRE